MNKEDILKKWLNDELTSAEAQKFQQEDDYALYQAIIDNAMHFKASHFSEPDDFEVFKSNYDDKKSATRKIKWLLPVLRIACVFLIALGVYFSVFYNNLTAIETLASQKTMIELPDQSLVTLNAGSQLEYRKNDWENNRSLNLEGEAYFKVEKGNTFDVITPKGTVTVVGTEFNVKQRSDFFEVQCYEGIVRVTSGLITKELSAGDTFRMFDNTWSQDNTPFLVPQWTQNKSYFKAIQFQEVIAEMERQFDVKIKLENVDDTREFTGSFSHKDFENALVSVTQPMGLTFKTNTSNQVVIYGDKK